MSQDDLEQIPLRYRLLVKVLLKLPNQMMPYFILKHFPEFEGIFWAFGVPILFMLYGFFNVWLFAFFSLHLDFPLNVAIGFLIPTILFLLYLRLQLDRVLLWWKNVHEPPREWQTSKKVEELVELFKRQQKEKKRAP